MNIDLNIDIRHLSRIEGHGDLRVRVKDGALEQARWDVVETPRFFEAILKGKHYTSAGVLTARICGICSISHCLASLRATEDAFGVAIPPAAVRLRLLAMHGETLQSHWLHLFFLAAPDFLGMDSVVPLLESDPELAALALRLRGLANRMCDLVAGRTTHPVTLQVGGVTRMPGRDELAALRDELARSLTDIDHAVGFFGALPLPEFVRETEYVALKGDGSYPFIGGRLASSDGVELEERGYLAMTNEYVVPDSTSKLCRLSRETMAVGALARYNINHRQLLPEAAAAAAKLGLAPGVHNPFLNNPAQLMECVQVTHESMALIEALLEDGSAETMVEVTPREGAGTSAVEAPRGILYHHYEYDGQGRIRRADCVIPTTQNNANIHHDLAALAAQLAAAGTADQEIERLCCMLVRAYDPCLSCSVH